MYVKCHNHRPFLRDVTQIGVRDDFKKPILEKYEPSRNDSHKESVVAWRTFHLDFPKNFTHLDTILTALGTQVLALGAEKLPKALARLLGAYGPLEEP